MALLIDIMTFDLTDQLHFTPAATATVDLLPNAAPAGSYELLTNYGMKTFAKGDNFIVLSMGLWLPECFALASIPAASTGVTGGPIGVQLGARGTAGIPYEGLLTGASGGGVYLPMENYELPLGIYVDAQQFRTSPGSGQQLDSFKLLASLYVPSTEFTPKVSMQNCPANLIGVKQFANLFFKIAHNLPLSA